MARVGNQSAGIDHQDEKQWFCHSAIVSMAESPWTCEGWEVQHSQQTVVASSWFHFSHQSLETYWRGKFSWHDVLKFHKIKFAWDNLPGAESNFPSEAVKKSSFPTAKVFVVTTANVSFVKSQLA